MHKRNCAIIIVLVLLPITVKAEFFSEVGCSASIGALSDHAVGHSDSEHDFYWHSVGLFGRHNFTQKWYGDFEGDIGYLYWKGSGEVKNDAAMSFEARLIILRKLFTHLHAGLGGGFCLLSDRHNNPGLGEDGLYGLITAKVRIPFKTRWGLDIETDHISGLVDKDSGRNVIKGRIYFTF